MIFNTVAEWWRGGKSEPVDVGTCYRTRVTLPAVVDLPVDVLRTLRQFNDDLDGYVHTDGRVWLLKYEAGKPRIREAQKTLWKAKQEGDYSELQAALLGAEGWSLLGELPYHEGTSVGAMLQHAQMTLYATDKEIEADNRRRFLIANGTTGRENAAKLMLDRVHAYAKTDWARAFRGRQVFAQRSS